MMSWERWPSGLLIEPRNNLLGKGCRMPLQEASLPRLETGANYTVHAAYNTDFCLREQIFLSTENVLVTLETTSWTC